MAVCETCGNDYYMAFEIRTVGGGVHVFDSFECAIHRLAPVCEHCGTRIIGHGAEVSGSFYCSAHCARTADQTLGLEIRDTVGAYPA
ncbi:Prokaryotic metallothionein [Dactylosporangium aurantiacum]|uniref:Prokaryotic metallothionein n=1 Tax=Dactylosporangium aurantiacum TaxID=35754 RepID=A0A9Q9IVV3_9ACTN|nr:hypothetical protein [Dactylosporangium aurantiacum]MDG6105145.1 Prokaryotic metallothionein [Dactylosporangium aurantiacum]UWZ59878.1 Prokaryotic metallothionein [Dactylosporangium aurantiacum]